MIRRLIHGGGEHPPGSTAQSEAMRGSFPIALAALTLYLWVLGSGLLLQGLVALGLHAAGVAPSFLVATHLLTDPRHSAMHVAWGLAMVGVLSARASGGVIVLGLVFGLFYTVLALVVAFAGSPAGMEIDASQNTFHFAAGPTASVLAVWALVARRVEV